ncbi:hypothetical protein ACFXKR_13685 [Streptomyces violascens]|uniref:hypothetical protein n=1 Tax=Streptomyces violascens TaxID=67381 RepID=UPI0036A7B8CF
MRMGLGRTVLATIAPQADRDLLAEHIRAGYPRCARTPVDSTVGTHLVLLPAVGYSAALAEVW